MSTSIVSLLKHSVPVYLQDGDFFKSLSDGDDEIFTISSHHFKSDTHITDETELDNLLSTLRFWGVESCPSDVLQWAWLHPVNSYEHVFMLYWEELMYLKDTHSVMTAPRENALNVALTLNNMKIVNFLLEQGLSYNMQSAIIAASTGNLAVLNAIDETTFLFVQDILIAAAQHGQLHIITEYLQRYPKVDTEKVCLVAAKYGQLATLELLFPPGTNNLSLQNKICENAAKHQQVACFKYVCTPFTPITRQFLHHACRSGNLECLQHAFMCLRNAHSTHDNNWEEDDFRQIIFGGNIECVKFALSTDCPINPQAAARAAVQATLQVGKLPIIEYLTAQNVSFADTAALAAQIGHFEILQYLRVHDPSWGSIRITYEAARYGRLECLKYAHMHGCVWNESVTRGATQYNKVHCLQYLHEQGCPWDASAMQSAICHKAHDCIEYLIKHNCPGSNDVEWL